MTTTSKGPLGGAANAVGASATTDRLKGEVQNLLGAVRDRAVGTVRQRATETLGRLTDYTEHGGGPGLMAAVTGAKHAPSGESRSMPCPARPPRQSRRKANRRAREPPICGGASPRCPQATRPGGPPPRAHTASTPPSAAWPPRAAGQHPAVRIELTGPWPSYSFAALEDEHAGRAPRDEGAAV